MISSRDIEAAAQRIEPYVRKTPVIVLEPGIWQCPGQLALKLESLQHAGSFKARGAFNRLLSQSVPAAGVIAASGGNHGIAVAFAAQQLGYRAEIFVPEVSARAKVERLRTYDAHVHIEGADYADALLASEARARQTGALVIHAYNQRDVIAGQGTVGYELQRQLPDLDTLLVAVGGGGLIAGIASSFQGASRMPRIIGVESEGTKSMFSALQVGHPVEVTIRGVAADALGARRVGDIAFSIVKQSIERVVLVNDEAILRGQRALWNDLRIIVEPAAAACVAALQTGAYQPQPDEQVGIILCGGNAQLEPFL